MSGITYFKLKSPYDGDVTKNCALKSSEVDNNFYTLEGRDIKSVEVNDGKIVINLMNGDKLETSNINDGYLKDISFNFDEENGILTITKDGVETKITGFTTNKNILDAIASNEASLERFTSSTDETLTGKGISSRPIGISPTSKTGQYRPVKEIIDMTKGEKLPNSSCVLVGDRYLTKEKINDFGFLYNYGGLKKIAAKLKESKSLWRIPTKEDWDDMLDAVEPIEDFRNHTDARSNKFLGKFSGKLLKSPKYWKNDEPEDCCGSNCNPCKEQDDYVCECGKYILCKPSYCGEYGRCHVRHYHDHKGINKYGFAVLPAGYANEAKDYLYFKERAYFWTASNHDCRDAYIKAFTYDRNKVLQDILASDNYLSVRLVKDYDGGNYNSREDILGQTYSTVLMPSKKNGKSIWTSVNVSFGDCGCNCKHVLPNDGQGMEYSIKYFTNEWTDNGWIRKELKDGESVVALEGSNDNNYSEYRVVNEELVDVASLIYDKVIDTTQTTTDNLKKDIEDLSEKLDNEINRSTEKDEELQNAIDTIINDELKQINERIDVANTNIEANKSAIDNTNKELQVVNQNLVDSINTINKNVADGFDTINNNVAQGFDTINKAIEAERVIRGDKDAELENKIQEETETRQNEINSIEEKIENEKNERITADEEIKNSLNGQNDKIDEIYGKILTKDGTVFNSENGVLTLKSSDDTNDIDVQFTMNFGIF